MDLLQPGLVPVSDGDIILTEVKLFDDGILCAFQDGKMLLDFKLKLMIYGTGIIQSDCAWWLLLLWRVDAPPFEKDESRL